MSKDYWVYSDLLQLGKTDKEPVQPRREDRKFLKYPDKPPLIPVKERKEVRLIEMPMIPRTTIEDLNFTALQYWLDHLGEAVYNPIIGTVKRGYLFFRDGGRRTRCLWEIGEPFVHVVLWNLPSEEPFDTGSNERAPTRLHFRVDPNTTMRQYYPYIYPFPPELKSFFRGEGKPYEDTLGTPMSFKEIVSRMPNPYRPLVVEAVFERVDIKGKRVLDVGCRDGWASLVLWEAGAAEVVSLDRLSGFTEAVNLMVGRRASAREGKLVAKCLTIQEFLQEEKSRFDVVLLLNVLHHLLVQDKDEGWFILRTLIERSGVVFVMTRNFQKVYEEFNKNIEVALLAKTGCKVEFILKCGERELFMLRKK